MEVLILETFTNFGNHSNNWPLYGYVEILGWQTNLSCWCVDYKYALMLYTEWMQLNAGIKDALLYYCWNMTPSPHFTIVHTHNLASNFANFGCQVITYKYIL